MRKNNRKKALLGSLITMLLCFAMLLGTTFAWFTLSVSSGTNAITAGNLDVKLEYAIQPKTGKDLSWQVCNGSLDLFGENFVLEPNSTGVVYFRVVNDGSLAMKYNYQVRLTENKIGTNRSGGVIDLTDHVQLRVVRDGEVISSGSEGTCNLPFDSRDAATAILSDSADPDKYLIKKQIEAESELPKTIATGVAGTLYPHSNDPRKPDTSDIFAIVVHMPNTVKNDANHNGENIPQISLQLDVVAAQKDFELDSFDKNYDADVTLPTIAEDNTNN